MDCYKHGYDSKEEANKVMRQISKRGGNSPKRAYKCKDCNKWHLTSRGIK